MLDWIGSLQMRHASSVRVELRLSRSTYIAGWSMVLIGIALTYALWGASPWMMTVSTVLAGLGVLLATLHRSLTVDRSAGILEVEHGTLGIHRRHAIPLFHLRAVVILARDGKDPLGSVLGPARFAAYVDRRVGSPIYLDESQRCADLLPMAEAIAEVAEIRLEYDATAQASSGGFSSP